MTGINCGFEFGFRSRVIVPLFGHATADPMRAAGVQFRKWPNLLQGLVFSASDYARCFHVKLRQIATRVGALGVESYRCFEFATDFADERRAGEDVALIGFSTVHPPKPQMILAIIRRERHRFFARRNSPVPLA